MVVTVWIVIFVATHHLTTMPGVTAIVVASPWMEFVIPFPWVVVNFSLFLESSDLSWSSGIGEGGRHGEIAGMLSGVRDVGGESSGLDAAYVVFLRGLL